MRATVDRRWPWWALFVGPGAGWAAHLVVTYLLVPFACDQGTRAPLHLVTVVTLAVGAASLVVGVRAGGSPRVSSRAPADDRPGAVAAGVVLGLVFLLAIAAGGLANLVIDPCA